MPTTTASFLVITTLIMFGLLFGLPPMIAFIACAVAGVHRLLATPAGAR